MSKISIITDTDASLPAPLAARYNIRQVPITVQFGEESFETGIDINDAKLFERIDNENKLPTTAAPSPGKWAKAFQDAFDEDGADEILCFTVSKTLSSTYDAAYMAATDLMEGKKITVVDTNSLSMAQGFMTLEAAKAIENGASITEAIAAAMALGERAHLYGALATLRYLAMSGRVGYVAAGMANLLNIKTDFGNAGRKIRTARKIRTRKKAWGRLVELTAESAEGKPLEQLAILHVNNLEAAHDFLKVLQKQIECPEEVVFAEITPGLSVHTGSGMVGVCFITK